MKYSKNEDFFPKKIALMEAIAFFGGVKKTADILGIKRQTIYAWISGKSKNQSPTLKYCKIIEEKTNGEITKEELRPDIFGHKNSLITPPMALKKGIYLIRQAFREISEGKQ